ncbi:hypothetical protein NP493_879g00023 [Ridgeia piscesae]|uniref:BTB domain-containing protein n=1 Tax=Ridgeia piscesae TaxID=27915 RepID=A0AAD9KLL4_RIDPI|nr:hypothetical protein NP493_879g00023 [Ridgeia piscesae]
MALDDRFMTGDAVGFAADMKKLINNKDTSDVKFVIGQTRKVVLAHRSLLSARCEVFRAMFTDKSQSHQDPEIPLVLSDMTIDIFLPMLEYIYTNCVTLTRKNAVDIMGTAVEFGLDGLRQLCIDYLIETLSVGSACEAMQAAVTYGQDELRNKAQSYVEGNTQNVFKSKSFHELSDTALATLLSSDRLDMDELEVIDAVREWATVNAVVLGKSITDMSRAVVPHIRLPLLSPEELKQVEDESKKDKLIPVEQFAYAWRYHALKQPDHSNPLTRKRKGTIARDSHNGMKSL